MTEDCLGLTQEGLNWLHRSAAHEVGQRLDVLGLGRVELRGKAPREDPCEDHVDYRTEAAGHDLPAFDDRMEKRVALRPDTVQGAGLERVPVLARQPDSRVRS